MNISSAAFLSLSRVKAILALLIAIPIISILKPDLVVGDTPLFNFLFWGLFVVYILVVDETSNKQDTSTYLSKTLQGMMFLLAICYLLLFFTGSGNQSYGITVILLYVGLDFILHLLLRVSFSFVTFKKFSNNRLVVIGEEADRKKISGYINSNPFLATRIVHQCDSSKGLLNETLNDLCDFLAENDADEILILDGSLERNSVKTFLKVADKHGVRLKFSLEPNWIESQLENNYSISQIGNLPILNLRSIPLDRFKNRIIKRSFDLALGCLFLLVSLPLFLIIAIAIKLESKGPVFYIPRRIGLNKKVFNCLKFRTMIVNDLDQSATKDDPRVTKVGRFLRKTSLDEFPQLINIIMGNMSLVGPRPHRISLNKEFQETLGGYMVRHYVKPGLTGWAQVNNFRGPAISEKQKVGRRNCDIWYIANWSPWLDLKIVILTFFRIYNQPNAF